MIIIMLLIGLALGALIGAIAMDYAYFLKISCADTDDKTKCNQVYFKMVKRFCSFKINQK